jgi:hypothetical protein
MVEITGISPDPEDLYDVNAETLIYLLRELDWRESDDDSDEEESDEEVEDEEERIGDYNLEFGFSKTLYREHHRNEKVMEYIENLEESANRDMGFERVTEEFRNDFSRRIQFEFDENIDNIKYNEITDQIYSGLGTVPDNGTYDTDILNIQHEVPELINGQQTYQRIVFEADRDGETVYELTMRKLGEAGIDVSSEYDSDFDSIIITTVNGRKEGQDGIFNEFYRNGIIGGNAVDMESVKKGDILEWRYAEETDGSCGGVPDFYQIKNMLQQGGMKNLYSKIMEPTSMASIPTPFNRLYMGGQVLGAY